MSLIGASNLSGERITAGFDRGMVPQSNGIQEGYVLSHSTNAGQLDNLAVDVPNGAGVLAGGRAFAGVSASQGTVNILYDGQVDVQKLGIAKCVLKINTACTAGTDAGYDPADGGPVQPVTSANVGSLVVIGRFSQSKTSSASPQFVGVELHAEGASGDRVLGAITASSAAITNTTVETAFSLSVPIPANRIQSAGTVLKIRAKANVTGGNSTDTLKLTCRLDTAAGVILGATPAVDVTNGGGDLGFLDIMATIRSVGVSGTMVCDGLGGISPGAAVATGGNVQVTGTASTVAIDTTAAHSILITATWSAASPSDSVVLEDLVVLIS
jgi:hypothetical protein